MVISLKEVIEEPLLQRTVIMIVVAVFITLVVYGVVGLIVKMDDIGLRMIEQDNEASQATGRKLVSGMPILLKWLTVVGTAAMLWVGGHILIVGAHELGWDPPYDALLAAEDSVHGIAGVGGVLGWLVNTGLSAVVGLIAGVLIVAVTSQFAKDGDH